LPGEKELAMRETDGRTGDYPIAGAQFDELERLRLQDEAWAGDAAVLLDRIGIARGWRCLDLGCGPKGLTDVLSDRVGAEGAVVGLEFNRRFVEIARRSAAPNTEIIQGDAFATGLPDGSFDLVHMRFLASTAGEPEALIAEAARLLRPGGVLATQEACGGTIACYPPNAACARLVEALRVLFPEVAGADPTAHRIYRLMRRAGLGDVGYRPVILGVRSSDPWRDFLPATSEALRGTCIERGLFTAEEFDRTVAECRAHLADPETVSTSPTNVQVWGRRPR
jgi:SAM-dependent methyltransferase